MLQFEFGFMYCIFVIFMYFFCCNIHVLFLYVKHKLCIEWRVLSRHYFKHNVCMTYTISLDNWSVGRCQRWCYMSISYFESFINELTEMVWWLLMPFYCLPAVFTCICQVCSEMSNNLTINCYILWHWFSELKNETGGCYWQQELPLAEITL